MSTKKEVVSCGNCGRRIQDHQAKLEIYNTRHRNNEYYHESHLGCYESTRESGRRVILNRFKPWLNAIYNQRELEPIVEQNWTT
jgi:hypothetical protein